jgi:hypothetical protein
VVVAIELVRLCVIRDEQIEPTVVVVVNERHAERFAGGVIETGTLGYVFECAVAQIVEEPRALALVSFRRAV